MKDYTTSRNTVAYFRCRMGGALDLWPLQFIVKTYSAPQCCCLLSEIFFSHKLFAPAISRARRWHTHSHTQAHPALPPLDQCIELWNDFYWRTFAYPSRQHANDGVLIAITKYKQRWNKQSFSTLYTSTLGCCVAATCSFVPTWPQRIKKLKYRIWEEWAIHC